MAGMHETVQNILKHTGVNFFTTVNFTTQEFDKTELEEGNGRLIETKKGYRLEIPHDGVQYIRRDGKKIKIKDVPPEQDEQQHTGYALVKRDQIIVPVRNTDFVKLISSWVSYQAPRRNQPSRPSATPRR